MDYAKQMQNLPLPEVSEVEWVNNLLHYTLMGVVYAGVILFIVYTGLVCLCIPEKD